ncbi:MAG TPA: ThiF family adenylyltransferase [Pyrinomonadaceae bacterium]|nr:ThiF family adenylyltransferase [Pyrinomonadaceae bacterium]
MNLDLSFLNAKLVLPVDYKSIEFWLVGAGGTGSFMAMNLARLAFELKTLGKCANIVIVDPDSVETGNIPRSNFCFAEVGFNKAETLAGRVNRAWGIEVGFVKEGFRPALLQSKNDDWTVQSSNSNKLTILVGCVDNHLARQQIHETLKFYGERSYDSSSPRVWWIDGGNGRDTGQVLIGNRLNEKEICESARKSPIISLLPAPSLQHPDLLREGENPVRKRPQSNERVTCAERILLGEQSLNVNQRVAVEINEMLTALLLTNSLKRFATYFDLESGTSRSLYTTPEKIEQAVSLAADKNRDASKHRKRKSKRK